MSSTTTSPSSLVALESKPLPFLLFPAEIRNLVYGHLLLRPKRVFKLKRVSINQDTWSLIGLANGNQQLRTEIRPMIFSRFIIKVLFSDYQSFVDAFYRLGNAGHPPLRVKILVNESPNPPYHIDMHSLLLARSITRGLHLEFECDRTLSIHSAPSKVLCAIRYPLTKWSRSLLRDVKSGYIKIITLRQDRYHFGLSWKFTIAKRAGGLTQAEVRKCQDYLTLDSELLEIKVTDLSGKHVEEWYARWREPLRKKVGKNWYKGVGFR